LEKVGWRRVHCGLFVNGQMGGVIMIQGDQSQNTGPGEGNQIPSGGRVA